MVKNPPALQETWVQSLGQEDPLEEEMQPAPVCWPGKSPGQRRLATVRGVAEKFTAQTGCSQCSLTTPAPRLSLPGLAQSSQSPKAGVCHSGLGVRLQQALFPLHVNCVFFIHVFSITGEYPGLKEVSPWTSLRVWSGPPGLSPPVAGAAGGPARGRGGGVLPPTPRCPLAHPPAGPPPWHGSHIPLHSPGTCWRAC